MPVTKTAKRALRGSKRKNQVNRVILVRLEKAVRLAKTSKGSEKIRVAVSLADRAVKKKLIHKNKANRIKSALAKLLPKTSSLKKKPQSKKKD